MTTTEAPPPSAPAEPGADAPPPRRRRSRSASWQRWSRVVHAYTSMVALLLVLFFGLTGITLNHPEWTFGDAPTTTTETGTFAFDVAPDGATDYLAVSEGLRDRYGIGAEVSDYQTTGDQGSISYRAPGYAADATFSTTTGEYRVAIEQQGFVGVMNDLHKGRDASSSWRWAIDLSGAFLVVIAASGLILQLVLKRRLRSAVIVAVAGSVVALVLVALTL
ncbi:MAG: PepSY-associated TM helix domain-containing protein [Acidimicrobiales bacterium]